MGKALEASVTLYVSDALAALVNKLGDELRFVLLTSEALVKPLSEAPQSAGTTELEGLAVAVAPASGKKCDRCWHVTTDVGSYEEHPLLCGRCVTNVDGEGEQREFA